MIRVGSFSRLIYGQKGIKNQPNGREVTTQPKGGFELVTYTVKITLSVELV